MQKDNCFMTSLFVTNEPIAPNDWFSLTIVPEPGTSDKILFSRRAKFLLGGLLTARRLPDLYADLGRHREDPTACLSEEFEALLRFCCGDHANLLALYRERFRYMNMKHFALCDCMVKGEGVLSPTLRKLWPEIQNCLIAELDSEFEAFKGRTFCGRKFVDWLSMAGIAWPLHRPTGRPKLDRQTFETMTRANPEVVPLNDLRNFLSQTRHFHRATGKR
jgi:hypothetical protein